MLANLSRREKSLFYLMAVVVSLSLMYNFLLKPWARMWSGLNRQILDNEIELKRNTRLINQENEIKRLFAKYAGYVKKRGSDEQEMTSLLNEVEKQARASGIHIANIKPKPIKDLGFCNKYILDTNCEATLEKYTEFIYNLQKSAQIIRVEKLELSSRGKDNPLLKARMLITKILTAR